MLSKEQIERKIKYIKEYTKAINSATASQVDSNANVNNKNIATLAGELWKAETVQTKRNMVTENIKEMYGEELAGEYLRQIKEHEIYVHDESGLSPYCASVSLFPFLLNGTKDIGGESVAPKHFESFNGSFINLVFALSSQFSGAIATVEWLFLMDFYARKKFGDNYLETNKEAIRTAFKQVVYSLNQPASARSYQSVFWNISIFDRDYFNELLGHYVFPEELQPKAEDKQYGKLEKLYNYFLKVIGKYKEEPLRHLKPDYDSLDKLQRYFMKWFNKERERAVLTFPVVTASFLTKDDKPKHPEFAEFLAEEMSEGNSFFIYSSDNASALSSCCRLLNQYEDNQFSYSLGAGGIATGSMNVITINANHLIQKNPDNYLEALKEQVKKIHKYQMATKKWFDYLLENDMLPAYSSGYITMKKQFLTIGINGLVEGAEFINITPNNNSEYKEFISTFLKVIYDSNKEARGVYGQRFNTEFVPAENLGVKNYKWDKKAGMKLTDKRECYNSYFYRVEDDEISIPDKFILHGKDNLQYLDGGSALHLNLQEYPTKEGYLKLIDLGCRTGCSYWTTNVAVTCCEDCGYINKNTTDHCTKCNSKNVTYATRIIGYLKKISSFSATRQNEAGIRFYHKNK